jgi:hypothetical protein
LKNVFFTYRAIASLSAHQRSRPDLSPPCPRSSFRPSVASTAQAHTAPRLPLPRTDALVPTALRHLAPRGGRMSSMPAGWRPVAPLAHTLARLQADRSALPTSHHLTFALSPSLPLTCPQPQRRRSAASSSLETSVSATLAHQRPLRLHSGSASPLRSWCLPPFALVSLHRTGMAHRS